MQDLLETEASSAHPMLMVLLEAFIIFNLYLLELYNCYCLALIRTGQLLHFSLQPPSVYVKVMCSQSPAFPSG